MAELRLLRGGWLRFRVFLAAVSVLLIWLLSRMITHVSLDAAVLGRYSRAYLALLIAVAVTALATLIAQIPAFHFHLRRPFRKVAIAAIAVSTVLVVAEIIVRAVDPLGISHVEETSRLWRQYEPDPVLVYRLPARVHGRYQGVDIATNELGLRERNLAAKQPGELRILVLGDSITFGFGVPAEQTYTRRLESILSSQLGRRVTTVNAGIAGYNTVQEYALLKERIAAVDPDMVVLLYLHNDVESNDPPFVPTRIIVSGEAGNALPKTFRTLLAHSWLYRLAIFQFSERQWNHPAPLETGARGVRESMAALEGMAALCHERGILFTTFLYREVQQYGAQARFFDDLFGALSETGRSNRFVVSDTRAWWDGSDRRAFTNSAVDWHPNARGHDILARGMAGVLLTEATADGGRRTSSNAAGF